MKQSINRLIKIRRDAIVASLTDKVCQTFSCGAGKREEALKTSAREVAAKPVMYPFEKRFAQLIKISLF